MTGPVNAEVGRRLLWFVAANGGNAVVMGPSGSGKTVLMKVAVEQSLSDYVVVVLDEVGAYGGYTDYHAPYPINPARHLTPLALSLAISDAIRAGKAMELSAGAKLIIERAAAWLSNEEKAPIDVSNHPRSLPGIAKAIEEAANKGVLNVEHAYEALWALGRARHWMLTTETHPLIERLLNGELRGRSVGIDLSGVHGAVAKWLYAITLMKSMEEAGLRRVILVIDELWGSGLPRTLINWLMLGASRGRHVVLVSDAPPDEALKYVNAVVKFPYAYMSLEDLLAGRVDPDLTELSKYGPHTAKLYAYATTEEAAKVLGLETPGYTEIPIRVEKPEPKPSAVTLKKCVEEIAGENAEDVFNDLRRNGFEKSKYRDEARQVWECIGR
jgi:vacuolar-type H+-ATPase catalytic subunit A/Vma1